jgi:P-type E1-E2 ATPase
VLSSEAVRPSQKSSEYLSSSEKNCAHCQLRFHSKSHDQIFCCAGCQRVSQWLRASHQDQSYYQFASQSPSGLKPVTIAEQPASAFARLDTPAYRNEHQIDSKAPRLKFFIDGIQCAACLWLLERLPQERSEVATARLNLNQSTLEITLRSDQEFAPLCSWLTQLGYQPHPIENADQLEKLQTAKQRTFLKRLAIAGASAGNVMLFSSALYTGAGDQLGDVFRGLTWIAALPAFVYSALPIYQSAWTSIKNWSHQKRISVDVPITLALAAGFIHGTFQIFSSQSEIYLDALTGLIFLLLASRYYLMRLQKASLSSTGILRALLPNSYRVQSVGSVVTVHPGEVIPADGTLETAEAWIDTSVFSGESYPALVRQGSEVLAGTKNSGPSLQLKIARMPEESRISQLIRTTDLELAKNTQDSSLADPLSDQVGQGFLIAILILAAIGFWIQPTIQQGVLMAVTLLIVACPCAIALANPLGWIRGYEIALSQGVVLKRPELLMRANLITQIAVDKTGTLTTGQMTLQGLEWDSSFSEADRSFALAAVLALESPSRHPIALALVRDLKLESPVLELVPEVTDWKETPGVGVSAKISSRPGQVQTWEIHATSKLDQAQVTVELSCDSETVATFSLRDPLRPESAPAIRALQRDYALTILTGDRPAVAQAVAQELSPNSKPISIVAQASPELKSQWVKGHPGTLYIGDGINDAPALSQATLGIAVRGSLEASFRAAHGYVWRGGIETIPAFLKLSKEVRSTVVSNLWISALYNCFAVGLTFSGHITPLIAALIMPVSASTVFVLTQLRIRRQS